MGKYAIGARVRDTDGDEGVIIDKRKGERSVKYGPEWTMPVWLSKAELAVIGELETAPKFKAGDKVRFTADGGYAAEAGATAIVIGCDEPFLRVDWIRDGMDHGQSNGGYSPSAFEPVIEPTLALRAGGYYKLRNGEIVGPLVGPQKFELYDQVYEYGAEPATSHTIWMSSGRFYEHDDVNDRDIVEEVPAPTSALTLEAGKFYRTRDGRKRVLRPTGDDTFPFFHEDENGDGYHAITADGKSCLNVDADDIVADWVDEPVAAEPALTIEVGKFYKTRDGRKAGPTKHRGRGFSAAVVDDWGGPRSYNSDGTHRYDETYLDLVEEWVEPEAKPEPKFKVGDRIRRKGLGHIGHVEAVVSDKKVKTCWDDEGWGATDPMDALELIEPWSAPIGAAVTVTGTVSGINGDKRSVVVGTGLSKFSFDVPASALKAA